MTVRVVDVLCKITKHGGARVNQRWWKSNEVRSWTCVENEVQDEKVKARVAEALSVIAEEVEEMRESWKQIRLPRLERRARILWKSGQDPKLRTRWSTDLQHLQVKTCNDTNVLA